MSTLGRLCSLPVLFCFAVLAGACQSEPSSPPDAAVQAQDVRTYGASVDTAAARAAAEVAAKPSRLADTTVTVQGRISTVCQKKGCWLALDTGTAMPIRVLVPRTDDGYEFTVPTTLAGEATVTGTLRTVELDSATQNHLAEDGASSARAREVQIAATGIRVVPGA
ncbi:DUF4920 domain-containing protein [Salinibacter ruber]|uniref:DUF4920 domain-containing protein n=1 Tax=Salinibacter ruber TaxID=146919 RepID=UPI002073292E|nr:DUF4920 domain-containing protein [Salinibacter ruber]MCS3700570.1 hypothetical protein [Salinibacter ruber]